MADTDHSTDMADDMPRIVMTEEVLGGAPRIEGHRIGVFTVYQRYVDGDESAETIADSYDLSVAKVHAALAYAFANPDAMAELADRHEHAVSEATSRSSLSPE